MAAAQRSGGQLAETAGRARRKAPRSHSWSAKVVFRTGWCAGHTARLVKGLRIPGLRVRGADDPLEGLRAQLLKGLEREARRLGGRLTESEIRALVDRMMDWLQRVFSGEMGVDGVPFSSAGGVPEAALSACLSPLIVEASGLSAAKRGLLQQILEENLRLREAADPGGEPTRDDQRS